MIAFSWSVTKGRLEIKRQTDGLQFERIIRKYNNEVLRETRHIEKHVTCTIYMS